MLDQKTIDEYDIKPDQIEFVLKGISEMVETKGLAYMAENIQAKQIETLIYIIDKSKKSQPGEPHYNLMKALTLIGFQTVIENLVNIGKSLFNKDSITINGAEDLNKLREEIEKLAKELELNKK